MGIVAGDDDVDAETPTEPTGTRLDAEVHHGLRRGSRQEVLAARQSSIPVAARAAECLTECGLEASPGPEEDRVWHTRQAKLQEIRKLQDDWDGSGAEAPSEALLDDAIAFLQLLKGQEKLPPPSGIGPAVDGTVLVEWQVADAYLEAVITDPGRVEWMFVRQGKPAEHWEIEWAKGHEASSLPTDPPSLLT